MLALGQGTSCRHRAFGTCGPNEVGLPSMCFEQIASATEVLLILLGFGALLLQVRTWRQNVHQAPRGSRIDWKELKNRRGKLADLLQLYWLMVVEFV